MKIICMFLREMSQFFSRKNVLGFIFVLLLGLYGCGEEDGGVGERLSGPGANSALPIRVDATVTPTPTVTPQAGQASQENQESPAPETKQDDPTPVSDLTPTPEEIQTTDTPTPTATDETIQQEEPPIEPSPIPTPVPTPVPEISAPPSEAETPKSIEKQDKTKSPQLKKKPKSTKSAQKDDNDKEDNKKKLSTRQKETQPEPEQQKKLVKTAEKPIPIVTSYGITLDQVTICSKITNRNPSGRADQFSISKVKKIYTWMKVSGAKPPMVVKHIYYWEGKVVATVKLKIKYPSMRTWSQKTFKPLEALGKWKVVITTENKDEVLAVKEFTVVP